MFYNFKILLIYLYKFVSLCQKLPARLWRGSLSVDLHSRYSNLRSLMTASGCTDYKCH